nr:flagellin [uncultured Tolumonas sp.]
MSLSVQTSYASLVTQNSLSSANDKLTTAMERLSTGYQVNSSADDAAGLSIATRMQSESDGIDVALDNVDDASSMLSTADGALDEMTDIVGRMKDLATSAANGTYSSSDVSAMNDEYSELAEQLGDIMSNTSYGGSSLLDTTDGKLGADSVTFQVGATSAETLSVDISDKLGDVNSGITTAAAATLTATNASATIDSMETLLANVTDTRSSLGASMNRLDYASENLTNMQENTDTAIGNIMDADYASETAEMSKQELLEQAGMSVLSGVSQMQSLITNLLG